MSKYIIKNCPAIYGVFLDGCKKDHYEDGTVLCKYCNGCILKQIVEKCKLQTQGIGMSGKNLADKILELLDIQEVE